MSARLLMNGIIIHPCANKRIEQISPSGAAHPPRYEGNNERQ